VSEAVRPEERAFGERLEGYERCSKISIKHIKSMKYFYMYILKCADNSFYVGHTDDLEKRMSEHHTKRYSGYTSTRMPVELVYSECFPTRCEALAAEQKIKKWSRKKKMALIQKDWALISELCSRKKN
jgi:predicted GIY-YIG superfamily endonuclease